MEPGEKLERVVNADSSMWVMAFQEICIFLVALLGTLQTFLNEYESF